MKSAGNFLAAFCALILFSCDNSPSDDSSSGAIIVEEFESDDQHAIRAAFDTALQDFVFPRIEVKQFQDESPAEYALRDIDTQLTAFRTRGIAHWRSNPNDPIIHDWLVATVALPPSYALDQRDWARRQFDLSANTSERDISAIREWERDYIEIRQQFFESQSVEPLSKRYVWSTELRQRLYRDREIFAATGVRPDADSYLSEFLEFVRTYPSFSIPVRESSRESYLASIISFLRPALGRRDIIQLSQEEMEAFLVRLESIDGDGAQFFAQDIRENNNEFTFHPFYDAHRSTERDILEQYKTFESFYESGDSIPFSVNGIFYSTPNYRSAHQPSNALQLVALNHDFYTGSLLILEKGRRAWPEMTVDQRYEWFRSSAIFGGPPFYPKDYLSFAVGNVDATPNLDIEELDYWVSTLRAFYRELVTSPEMSESQTQTVELIFARRLFNSLSFLSDENSALREQYQSEFFGLLASIVTRSDDVPELIPVSASLISQTFRYSDRLGLTETEVRSFIAQLPNTESEEINSTINSVLNPTELRPGVEIRIEATTLDGQPFDSQQLRGSIVLIDHWDTNCGPCIAAMPGLHEVYERYKDRGVDVVSIAYDGTSQRSRVERIKQENGLTWISLDGEGLWPAISAQYGYRGVPQYMLLDREGRWYAGTEEMGNGANFEALLIEMLDQEEE